MRALTQSLVLYVYLIFGQYYHGRVLPFMFGAWLYHNFSSLSRHLSPWQVGLFNPLNSNPKGNPTKALLKTSRFYRWDFPKTLDFIEFLGCSSAFCEKRFSQFSRNLLATFLHFLAISEAFRTHFPKGSGTIRDNLITYGGISKRS